MNNKPHLFWCHADDKIDWSYTTNGKLLPRDVEKYPNLYKMIGGIVRTSFIQSGLIQEVRDRTKLYGNSK